MLSVCLSFNVCEFGDSIIQNRSESGSTDRLIKTPKVKRRSNELTVENIGYNVKQKFHNEIAKLSNTTTR